MSAARAVALAGNPNVGKSSIFNALTGLRQHTGNWPGKTVETAQGRYDYGGAAYALTDLPGTYSLAPGSEEERVAAEFLQTHPEACVVAVCDATCLGRSLTLAVQLMQRHARVIVCVNLMDEARTRGLTVDLRLMQTLLGVPVVGTCASCRDDLRRLQEMIRAVMDGFWPLHPHVPETHAAAACARYARTIAERCVSGGCEDGRTARLDHVLTGKCTGRLVFAGLVLLLFGLTLTGANVCSDGLQTLFDALLRALETWLPPLPGWLRGALLDGVCATTARVTAVMLPPAAIFFFLFSVLEDAGYLPRAAFLADHAFERCGASGRQALTMCMGLGCNAAGVMGCRILPTREERLSAAVTNSMTVCNGRFPLLLTMGAVVCGEANGFLQALLLSAAVALGICGTFLVTRVLHGRQGRGARPPFVLELPPYRRPNLKKIAAEALAGKTLHLLGRAVRVAAPAGLLLWLLGETNALPRVAEALDGTGRLLGMNGAMLAGFLCALPANELAVPVMLSLLEGTGESAAAQLLSAGVGAKAAVCCMIFCVFHWPCTTTLQAIRRETGSVGQTILAALLPTAIGAALCMLVNWVFP